MRITSQLIRQRATGPLPCLEHLDLSNLNIDTIEKLGICRKLQYINLQANCLQEVGNLRSCSNLWSINLSCNQIQCLDGISKFLCFGELILSFNDLSWKELVKIRHIHILNLSLHGNPQLEKDHYYRIHVIDCLPNVWMLDGRIITSAERIQVKNFFQDSALSDHPVRRKLTKDWFITSSMKNIEIHGLFGSKATNVLTRFPTNAVHNIEMDKRRLLYLAHTLQEELLLYQKVTKSKYQILKYQKTFLEELLSLRTEQREKCNMLLLLLVASLEFILPTHLVQETLITTELQKLGKIYTLDIFFLPREVRCKVVSVLLSAVKIDKDNKENGGLYDKLYLCLFYTVSELTRISQSTNQNKSIKDYSLHKEYKSLLAAEIVQLLCIVPAFYEYIEKDIGIKDLLITATGDKNISLELLHVVPAADLQKANEEISDIIISKLENNMVKLSNSAVRHTQSDIIISKMKTTPIVEVNSAIYKSEFHTKGITSPESNIKTDPKQPLPELGDLILLGPQTVGKIISVPQSTIALLSVDAIPVSNGSMVSKLKDSEDHYTYINMNYLQWDQYNMVWKPKGTTGDRITLHSIETFQKEIERRAEESDETLRPNSPDESFINAILPGSYKPTEPLIYTPRHTTPRVPNTSPNKEQKTPRPMSSVLKDKLHLKLDLSKRAKSAAVSRQTGPQASSRRLESNENVTTTEDTDNIPNQELKEADQIKDIVESILEDCISKAENPGETCHGQVPATQITDDAASCQICEQPDQSNTVNTIQNRPTSSNSEIIKTDTQKESPISRPYSAQPSVSRTDSKQMIQVQIPKFEIEESESARSQELDSQRKDVLTSKMSNKVKNNITRLPLKPRPFSAVDAYKTFIRQPAAGNYKQKFNGKYDSEWKFSSKNIRGKFKTANPPPQRPSSPISRDLMNSAPKLELRITRVNDWLGGGRDLHKEMKHTRPKSGHIPGWKDGLPETLTRRPKSAITPRSHRVIQTMITPTPLVYDKIIYGTGSLNGSCDLPELPSLSDYPSSYQQSPSPRQLGFIQPKYIF